MSQLATCEAALAYAYCFFLMARSYRQVLATVLMCLASPVQAEGTDAVTKSDRELVEGGEPNPSTANQCTKLSGKEAYMAGEFDASNPIYPITYRYDFMTRQMGEEVLALRIMECAGGRNFAVFTRGRLLRMSAAGNPVLVREGNIAVVKQLQ